MFFEADTKCMEWKQILLFWGFIELIVFIWRFDSIK